MLLKVGGNKSHSTNDPLDGNNKYTANDIYRTIELLVDYTYIYVRFGGRLSWQMVAIPIGENCASLLADLFLYSYESEVLDKPIKEGKESLLESSISHIVILTTLSLLRIKDLKSSFLIFTPKELTIPKDNRVYFSCFLSRLAFYQSWEQQHNHQTIWQAWHIWLSHCDFSICQAIFHLNQPMVCMHLSSFSMSVAFQIIVTSYHAKEPWWQVFWHRFSKLMVVQHI